MNHTIKRIVTASASAGAIGAAVACFAATGGVRAVADGRRHTVENRTAAILAKKPWLQATAAGAGGRLEILVFKRERCIEVHAPGWKAPLTYPMTAFSGKSGPKLREGDRQIPEGIYRVSWLNPNSKFYLSMKVSYPNESDRARAKADGRTGLGGDIMIHGKAVTIGCVPIGDDAIEDLFFLAAVAGPRNTSVVIAPYDMRNGRVPELERSPLKWYPALCREIDIALSGAVKLYDRFLDKPWEESLMDVVMAIENGYWDVGMLRYVKAQLEAPARTLCEIGGVALDSHSLAVFLAAAMLHFNPPSSPPGIILSRSVPDESEKFRGFERPFRIHLFKAGAKDVSDAVRTISRHLAR